jgi:hypothetical protein
MQSMVPGGILGFVAKEATNRVKKELKLLALITTELPVASAEFIFTHRETIGNLNITISAHIPHE